MFDVEHTEQQSLFLDDSYYTVKWFEWLNRFERPTMVEIVKEYERTINHHQAVKILKARRPKGNKAGFDAAQFWTNENRGLLLYCLLTRASSVDELEHSVGLPTSKSYTLLRRWHIRFKSFAYRIEHGIMGADRHISGKIFSVNSRYFLLMANGRILEIAYNSINNGWIAINDAGEDMLLSVAYKIALSMCYKETYERFKEGMSMLSYALCGLPLIPKQNDAYVPQIVVAFLYGQKALDKFRAIKGDGCPCLYFDGLNKQCFLNNRIPRNPFKCKDLHLVHNTA